MAIEIGDYLATQRGSVGMVDRNATSDALESGQSNLSTSFDTFLSLLTTQLKNQDPLSPLDTNSFTQQLVQMTGVQQQLLSNQLLKQLVVQGENGDVRGAIGLIGKTATAFGDEAVLKDGEAGWLYELGKTASQVTLTVTDSNGRVMWTGDAPSLEKGEHTFSWNGQGDHAGTDGQTYRLTVKATDANGGTVASQTYIHGLVSSVRQTAGGSTLDIGGVKAPVTAVIAVKG